MDSILIESEYGFSHRHGRTIKPCVTHRGPHVFPICDRDIKLEGNAVWQTQEPDYCGRINFSLCFACEDKLWQDPPPATDEEYCKCVLDLKSQRRHDAAVQAGEAPWSCRLCVRYDFYRHQAIQWGFRCETCFPTLGVRGRLGPI